jgi:kinesin family protein 18/19
VVPQGKKVKDQVFAFDRIFDENASQTDVYEGTTRQLIDSVLDGYNATVFAYGATGCGKTHTITGTSSQPGIIFLTMQELFEKINERSADKQTEISLSYLEIYNETIRDLLVPGGSKQGLMLREDANQGVSVAGLTSLHPKDVQQVMDMIVQGNEYRTVSPTEANAVSSRSHAVLQINVAQKDRNAGQSEPHTMATLSIIDLAGSERASATKNRGERLLEGANINKSLLALGSCINALCDPRKKNHVPYRNSKLTRLLKFSLGGNCKTVMIVCVSPSSAHFDETQNTLRYANRAKNIQTKVTRNVFNVNRHVKDFLVKIDEQMAMINELKAQQKDAEQIFFAKFKKQLDKSDVVVREGVARLRTAYENAASERAEKITNMKKLRAFERRISMLSAWIGSFDSVVDARESEESMPPNLAAMRKTATGILAELEHSRQHIHQRLERSNWERALDTALQHSISQLGPLEMSGTERDTLHREAEMLKTTFMRDAYHEVMEQDRGGEAAIVQVVLTAQFDIIASLSEALAMNEEEAVAHAKGMINRLLEVGYRAAGQVVKPDGSIKTEAYQPPTKRGTPKRKKHSMSMNVVAKPLSYGAAAPVLQQDMHVSPMKSSPRKHPRKAPVGPRKGLHLLTPKKRSPSRGRMVRWRDDETESGLADYDKTPKKFESSPEHGSPAKPPMPSYRSQDEANASDSSPSLKVPDMSSLNISSGIGGKPNRFQAGFLSKANRPMHAGSPPPPTFSLNLSDEEDKPSPLRSIPVSRAGNAFSPQGSPSTRIPSLTRVPDENNPPVPTTSSSQPPNHSGSEDDDSSSLVEISKLRSALHSAKRRDRPRLSSHANPAGSSTRRISSIGSSSGHRLSSSISISHGISRQRRNSGGRSPPIQCSPPPPASLGGDTSAGREALRAFTATQARRVGMGGSVRESGRNSPEKEGKTRRITIGSGAALIGNVGNGGGGGSVKEGKGSGRGTTIWR